MQVCKDSRVGIGAQHFHCPGLLKPSWGSKRLRVSLALRPRVPVAPPDRGGAGSREQQADTSAATQRPWGHPRAASDTALPLVTIPKHTADDTKGKRTLTSHCTARRCGRVEDAPDQERASKCSGWISIWCGGSLCCLLQR